MEEELKEMKKFCSYISGLEKDKIKREIVPYCPKEMK